MSTRLYRVVDSIREYKRLSVKIEELEAAATKITSTLSPAPKGGGEHYTDDVWAKLADYKSLCKLQWLIILEESLALEDELDCIRNSDIRTAMKYKYVDGMTVSEISEQMQYSSRNVDRFLQKGRRIYDRYYKEIE